MSGMRPGYLFSQNAERRAQALSDALRAPFRLEETRFGRSAKDRFQQRPSDWCVTLLNLELVGKVAIIKELRSEST